MQQVYHSDGNLLDMSFPLNAGDQIALDDAFQRLLKQNGIANGLPFSLSSALTSSGGSVTPSAVIAALAGQDAGVQSLTITNPNDATTVILDMNFGGFGYLTIRPQGLVDNTTGGLDCFGEIFAGGGGMFVNSADPSADPPVVGGSFGWSSGQRISEGATSGGTLSTQYISTVSNIEVGYTGGGTASRKIYLDAGSGDVLLAGKLGVGNSAAASVAVGTLVKKIEIFDAAGTSLGFVPVYSSIT